MTFGAFWGFRARGVWSARVGLRGGGVSGARASGPGGVSGGTDPLGRGDPQNPQMYILGNFLHKNSKMSSNNTFIRGRFLGLFGTFSGTIRTPWFWPKVPKHTVCLLQKKKIKYTNLWHFFGIDYFFPSLDFPVKKVSKSARECVILKKIHALVCTFLSCVSYVFRYCCFLSKKWIVCVHLYFAIRHF